MAKAKKPRKKIYNPSKLKQDDVRYLFENMVSVAGTGLKGTTVCAPKTFKTTGAGDANKKAVNYYGSVFDVAYDRLTSSKVWTIITVSIVDYGNKVKTHERVRVLTDEKADTPEFIDMMHEDKLDVISNVNPKYLIGVYTIACPYVITNGIEIDNLVTQLLGNLDDRGLLIAHNAYTNFRLRLSEYDFSEMEQYNLTGTVGEMIKANYCGFDIH